MFTTGQGVIRAPGVYQGRLLGGGKMWDERMSRKECARAWGVGTGTGESPRRKA